MDGTAVTDRTARAVRGMARTNRQRWFRSRI